MAEVNAACPPTNAHDVRLGINLGDVLIEGGDIYGEGVNVAARLHLGGAGRHLRVGQGARRSGRKTDAAFEDVGERELKNIAPPVRIFRVQSAAPARRFPCHAPPPRTTAKTESQVQSVVQAGGTCLAA